MNVSDLSGPLVAGFVIAISLLVVLSIITLFNYFFGGPDPMRSNAQARVDAAQKPEILLADYRRYQRRKAVGALFVVTVLFGVLVFLAPEAAMTIVNGIWMAGVEIAEAIQESATIMAAQVGNP